MMLFKKLFKNRQTEAARAEAGSALMQVLVALTIISVMSLGLMEGSMSTNRLSVKATRHLNTSLLAQSRMNEFASTNPELLIGFNGEVEVIELDGVDYERTVTVTIEPDRTRLVTITVEALNSNQAASTTLESGFALWGLR